MKTMYVISAKSDFAEIMKPIAVLKNNYPELVAEVVENWLVKLGYNRKMDADWFDEIISELWSFNEYDDSDGDSEVHIIISKVEMYN